MEKELVERGKKYIGLFKTRESVWDYNGPAFRIGHEGYLLDQSNTTALQLRGWKRWNDAFEGRVLLDAADVQEIHMPEMTDRLDLSTSIDSISDENLLMCSGCVTVQYLSDRRHIVVAVDDLSPVTFGNPISRNRMVGSDEETKIVESLLASHLKVASRSSKRIIFMVRCKSFGIAQALIEQEAGSTRRVCIGIDLHDFESDETSPEETLREIVHTMGTAVILKAVVCFRNFAALVAKRSFNEPRSYFVRVLGSFEGVAFILLDENDETDDMFDRLNPHELKVVRREGKSQEEGGDESCGAIDDQEGEILQGAMRGQNRDWKLGFAKPHSANRWHQSP
ncbi:hypothetical protein C8035_v011640 [Colletotrichum spinosum]|uniref:Uncharacterized protein n=1 Tax=Colletotrichum spinosum TaxID=1347390 RepID=A0A4R8Q3C9_9PEZI|nr:hypothetical protein C8035_v011640 [Colletotrichum spinosum]